MCPDKLTLSAWFDGEIPEEGKLILDKHVSGCAECSKWYETMKVQRTLMQNLDNPISEKDKNNLYNRITQKNVQQGQFLKKQIPWTYAASFALLFAALSLFAGFIMGKPGRGDAPLVDTNQGSEQPLITLQELFDDEQWPFERNTDQDVYIWDVDSNLSYLNDDIKIRNGEIQGDSPDQ